MEDISYSLYLPSSWDFYIIESQGLAGGIIIV